MPTSAPIVAALLLVWSSSICEAQVQPERFMAMSFYYAPPPVNVSRAAPVFQGLAVSTDRGTTWNNRGWVTSSVSDAVLRIDGGARTIFLATDYGVLRSSDDGQSWKLVTGWDMPAVLGIAVSDADIWIATSRGVYHSSDGGDRWTPKGPSMQGINASYVNDITITPREIFIATADGLFRTSDKGSTWIRTGLEGREVFRIIADPFTPTTLAAISQTEGVWVSEDGGWNWSGRNSGLRSTRVKSLAFSPHEKGLMIVGTRDTGVFRSTSHGNQWELAGGGLTNFNITALAFDLDQPDRVYAGAENGSFVSNTKGASWQPFSIRLGYVSTILLN